MTPEAQEARRQYLREWRKCHPENCRRYRESYWQRKADALKAEATRQQDDKQTSEK